MGRRLALLHAVALVALVALTALAALTTLTALTAADNHVDGGKPHLYSHANGSLVITTPAQDASVIVNGVNLGALIAKVQSIEQQVETLLNDDDDDDDGRVCFTIYAGASAETLYALSPNGTEEWRYTAGNWILTKPTIGPDGTIFIGVRDNRLYAIRPDGSLRWQFTTQGHINSQPTIGDNYTIYFASYDDNFHAVRADGSSVWVTDVMGDVYGRPAISPVDGTIYFGNIATKQLIALNPSDGSVKWRFDTGQGIYSSPTIGPDGTIYIGSYDHFIYAVNPNGTEKWSYRTSFLVTSTPAFSNDNRVLYCGSQDSYVYAFHANNGTLIWRTQLGGQVKSSPEVGEDGTIYIGCRDTYVYALQPNGDIKWRFRTGAEVFAKPVLGPDKNLYVSSRDEHLYALNIEDGSPRWNFTVGNNYEESAAFAVHPCSP